jgi:hypothetical protein
MLGHNLYTSFYMVSQSRSPAFISLFCRMTNFLAFAISVGVIGIFTKSFQSPVNGTGNGVISEVSPSDKKELFSSMPVRGTGTCGASP